MTTSKHRIGLPPQLRALYIDRIPEIEATEEIIGYGTRYSKTVQSEVDYSRVRRTPKVAGYWLLPIHTNPDHTLGTFLKLYDDGKIERVTVREDEGDEVVLIKPTDREIDGKKK